MAKAPSRDGSRHALVVATARYTDSAFRQLRAPAQDAADVVEVLADPAIGRFSVTSVLDRPEYEIRRTIASFLHERRVDDLVLIYLSCHGVLDARGNLFLAAADTIKEQPWATAVDSAWLQDRLEECRARRQVVIVDSCFSGAFGKAKGAGNELELDRRLLGSGRGRAVLTASRATEYSFEGDPLPGLVTGGSVFTAALVDGIRSGDADRDGDGLITVDDAFHYAADQMNKAGSAQTPQRTITNSEGEIVLNRPEFVVHPPCQFSRIP